MKTCKECGIEKPLTEYYTHNAMADGFLNKCRDCVKSRASKHRNENIEQAREYDKKRNMLSHRVAARKEYLKTDAGKKAKAKTIQNYRERHTKRYYAQTALNNALRDGKIMKLNCFVCGNDAEAHHPDYDRPLDVVWLCKPHHKEAHNSSVPF